MFSKSFLVLVGLLWQPGSSQSTSAPVVDLEYARYQGYHNETYGVNTYKGMRYAAPPVGELRWQLPQPPTNNRTQITPAIDYGSMCPQSRDAVPIPESPEPPPSGSEDCLFINVLAPAEKKGLPVMVWIHGGGYGVGSGNDDWVPMMSTNGNSFVTVSFNYRLGAFGFLSSSDVAKSGVLNAGIHDMHSALQWVQKYIHLFGGDPTQVTIVGVSAGAGAVMQLGMIYGGALDPPLFNGIISASPYLPPQWDYDDIRPTEYYYQFADSVGCLTAETSAQDSVFECLVAADSAALRNASNAISASSTYGGWSFVPVTDKTVVQQRPSSQLAQGGDVNGVPILTSNMADEGPDFTPLDITSEFDFRSLLFANYPRLSEDNMTSIFELYALSPNASAVLVDTDGEHAPFSTTNSQWAAGWQQVALNMKAETTFVCPSYWLADAFARKGAAGSWRFQLSVPPAHHGLDLEVLVVPKDTVGKGMDQVLRTALHQVWGNFVVRGDPSLTPAQMDAADSGNVTAGGSGAWPQWAGVPGQNWMLNMNMTGGVPTNESYAPAGAPINVTIYEPGDDASPPMEAAFTMAEGSSWKDGRGERCRLWAELGPWILE
ncbi:alpha/beta-hydrolase [Hypoxylon sp. FL1284]|nr:alpha/beta-hydrolase [Hypoxylon sp. FL1284]